MKAVVYHGPNKISYDEVAKPELDLPTDAIVKVLKTTICGTDLHIIKGDVPEVESGTTLGHEGIGIVESVGSSVSHFKVGDKVIISCITSCGSCRYCKKGLPAHCEDGGWILGHLINGTQADYVRIPHADNSLYPIPDGVDDDSAIMLSDILPTGFEIGVLNGQVKPGDRVAFVGAGPVGMAAMMTSQFYSPSEIIMIDVDDNRLEVARQFGATTTINPAKEDVQQRIDELTQGDGVEVAVECVGVPATFDICQKIVGKGGHLANVGVHGQSVDLQLQDLWIKNIHLTTGLVNATSTPMLLNALTAKNKSIEPDGLVTHHFDANEFMHAYEVFGNAAKEKAMKVVISCS
ncbi:zinc-dependent alcohol dehydrogenase family protein [Celerinatantimonas diazotrophica]|uniref:Alcohol dehydrogenase n=1 Tax=Celerinatantimonas diazotrophica TaxID=412034 RepID=A0A4R1J9X1_9GAMM|nr:zinc-dependent alcohol dehydrogenase family protein [Celerinatantimonas diazotrophica]TCK47426.1 alcohol dehydrogenase [Celerinatantimonas diazotrophica]CAG9294956.1 Alcohol dehydrogenase [Celerinatantimonas diazotrophica]